MHRSLTKLLPLPAAAAALLAVGATARAQGDNAFLRGEGKTDIALNYSEEKFESFWVGDNKVRDPNVGKVYRESWNLWAAYGLTKDVDIVGTAAIVTAYTKGAADIRDNSKVQDGTLGAKWRVFEQRLGPGAFTTALTPAVKIPLSHYQANSVTALGDGQIDFRFRGVVQYTADCGAFLAIEAGYDVRMSGTPNQIPINVSLGATFFNRLTVTPFWEYMNAQGGKDIGQDDFPDVQEDFTRWGVGTYFRLNDRIGATAGYKATIDGKNTGDSWSWWVGLVFKI